MKKIFPLFLAFALVLCCAPALLEYAFAAEVVSTGSCGDNLTYTLTDDGVFTISGTGAMTSYSSTTMPWYSYLSDIKTIVIEEGVTEISSYAFYGSSVVSAEIAASVTKLGYASFLSKTLLEVYFLGAVAPSMDEAFSISRSYALSAMYLLPENYESFVASYTSGYADYSFFFFKVGDAVFAEFADLSDFLISSSVSDDETTNVYHVSCTPYSSTTSYTISFFDNHKQNVFGATSAVSLKPYDKVFRVSDLIELAKAFDVIASYTYTINKQSSYKGNAMLFLHYFDENGDCLSYDSVSGSYGYLAAGTQTVSVSLSNLSFPAGTEYVGFTLSTHSFSGLTVSSLIFDLEVTVYSDPPVLPVEPSVSISFSPTYSYTTGAAASALSVSASVTDDGVLSYQWYENTTNSTDGGTPITGATSASFTPPTDAVGTKYYYCAITNTLGEYTATVYSHVATVSVSKPVAAMPTVTANYASSYSYKLGETASSISVTATAPDGGTLTYQWYMYPENSIVGAVAVSGATSSSYTPPISTIGTIYYYCVVTNTLGDSTATTPSSMTAITIEVASYILDAGQWEAKTSIMTGEYLALDAWPDGLGAVDLAFRASGVACSQMSYQYDLLTSRGYGIYYDGSMAYSYGFAAQEEGFISDAYALIFLEADQEVPTEFYEWFTSCFKYVGADEEIPVYHTIINIYDNAGATLLDSFDAYGNGVSPILYCSVTGDGFSLIYGTGYTWNWTTDSEVFFGFATTPESTVAWWVPGETFEAGGLSANYVVTLYVIDSSGVSVDGDYQESSLNWFERIWNACSETFMWSNGIYNIAKDHAEKIATSAKTFVENNVFGFLRIIDFASIGEFFRNAYEGVSTCFGLMDLLSGEDSPFAWLIKE